jgi:hypothetical protein
VIVVQGLWSPTPKDLSGQTLEWRSDFVSASAAAIQVSANLGQPVVADRVWNITNVTFEVSPDGAQIADLATVVEQFADAALGTDRLVCSKDFTHPRSAVGLVSAVHFQTNYFARPGSRLVARCNFDLGAAVNQFTCTVGGWLIPRGNIQFLG